MLASAVTDWAVLITASAAAVGVLVGSAMSVITAVSQMRQVRATAEVLPTIASTIGAVHAGVERVASELVTLNGSTVGQLADQDETRRIEQIDPADRTPLEAAHVEAVPPRPGAEAPKPEAP